jgi:hypothetical protein
VTDDRAPGRPERPAVPSSSADVSPDISTPDRAQDAAFETVAIDASASDEQPLELAELLNSALDKGVVVHGDVTLAVADIDLIKLNLGLLLSAFETLDSRAAQASSSSTASGPGAGETLARRFGPPNLFGASGQPSAASAESSQTDSAIQASRGAAGTPSASASAGTSENAPVAGLAEVAQGLPPRINADAPGVESGLARLVLTLIEVLRKVLEHQAIRRMDGGTLTLDEIERLGLALSRLHGRIQELKAVFQLTDEDLQIDLGPLGRVR